MGLLDPNAISRNQRDIIWESPTQRRHGPANSGSWFCFRKDHQVFILDQQHTYNPRGPSLEEPRESQPRANSTTDPQNNENYIKALEGHCASHHRRLPKPTAVIAIVPTGETEGKPPTSQAPWKHQIAERLL